MRTPNESMIAKAQQDYLDLLLRYESPIFSSDLTMRKFAAFLDEIEIFWLKRIDIISYELESLTNKAQCFLLSGAIYLDIEDNEHCYFKTLGDYHVLSDPLLKMEVFARAYDDTMDNAGIIRYLRDTYEDTGKLLQDYSSEFFILPIRKIVSKSEVDYAKVIETFYWRFMSTAFNDEFRSPEEFTLKYKSFTQIEEDLNDLVLKDLIFTDNNDSQLCLEDRIKRYCDNQMNSFLFPKDITDSQAFLNVTYCYIGQIIGILLTCTLTGLIPFIRSDVTFRYLTLVMYTFIDNPQLRAMLEKTVIFYVLYKVINRDCFQHIDFSCYSTQVREARMLDKILDRMNERKLDVFTGVIDEIAGMIRDEFLLLGIIPNYADR